MFRTTSAVAAGALALFTCTAHAQRAGSITGTLTDSLHGGALVDASVFMVREVPAQPELSRSVTPDNKGRYRLDSLQAGRYAITFNHAMLDSLELFYPPRVVELKEGETVQVDFAIPSGATLRRAACPGVALPAGLGGVVGRVTDADTERPLGGALVVVSWTDLTVDRATLRATATERSGAARADSSGVYRLCGVATASPLAIQVQVAGRAGSAIRAEVPDDIGFVRLDLAFSATASRSLSEEAPPGDTVAAPPLLTGNATLTGYVKGAAGQPLPGVELRVLNAAGSTRTDSLGRFTLGALPAGSQLLEARRVGYLIGRRTVLLRGAKTTEANITLQSIVSLDSIRVVAQRMRYREFEERRRSGLGRYMSEDQIAKQNAFDTSDLLRMMPGFRVTGEGLDARVVSTRARGFSGSCSPNIVIDNMPNQEINLIHPGDIGAMEFYNDGAGGPPGMNRGCGVIVIWTKR